MPSTVNLYLIGVWFCVGFFTGAGWAVAPGDVAGLVATIEEAAVAGRQELERRGCLARQYYLRVMCESANADRLSEILQVASTAARGERCA